MQKSLLLMFLILCINVVSLFASDLPNSRKSSYYKYIYKLTPKEARSIYKKGLAEVNESYLHTLTDSVPNDSIFNQKLPQGNYLLVWAKDNELQFEMRSYSNIEVLIHNNYADLMLTVSDTMGFPVKDAKIMLNGIPVKFDVDLQLYRNKRLNKTGWLEVTYNNFTSYHYMGNNVKKGLKLQRIVYTVPIKYVYIPAKLAMFLPYDLVKSCIHLRPYGVLYYIYKPFRDTYSSIFRYGTYGYINKIERLGQKVLYKDYKGYMVFSKPKYCPNDTVRFKAFITRPNGIPISKQMLKAELNANEKKINLGNVEPNRRGSYDFEFVLHDSLNLRLDQSYQIKLEKNGWNDIIYGNFYYEDYELKNISYTMRMDKNNHMKGQTMYAYLKGEDTNGLNVPDGRVILTVTSEKSYDKLLSAKEFLPDTIFTHSQPLDPVGETTIELPDSVFPRLNFKYKVKAVFLTADNERIEKFESVNYYYEHQDVDISFRNDSVFFVYENLGKEAVMKAELKGYDKNGNQILDSTFNMPDGIAANYFISSYRVKANEQVWNFNLNQYAPSFGINSERTNHKVHLQAINKEGIWFNYFVYKHNVEVSKGYTQQLDTVIRMSNTKGCFVAVNYEWGGKTYEKSYEIPLYKNRLNVSIHQPQVIYPGQKAELTVEVTDFKNRPVSGVDLTSWGITKKFKYSPPTLAFEQEKFKQRTMFNNYFSKGDTYFGAQKSLMLNYNKWRDPMGLDTISYYRFTRPDGGMNTQYLETEEQITQFAPYVYKEGKTQQINFLYVDYRLVYTSFSTNGEPYSFKVDPGFHKVRIRTTQKDITVDSVYFKRGMKTLLSIDQDSLGRGVIMTDATPKLTINETRLLNSRYARFNTSGNYGLVYLQQDGRNYLLKGGNGYYGSGRSFIVGPFSSGNMKFVCQNEYSTDFDFEGSYEYFISLNKVKMKTRDNFWGTQFLSNNGISPAFDQMVLSDKMLAEMGKTREYNRIQHGVRYDNPYFSHKGNGTLCLDYATRKTEVKLQNILVFKDDNPLFMRIYPAYESRINDLKPGSYRLFFSMEDGSYHQYKNVEVKRDGLNIIRVTEPYSLINDEMSEKISQLIKNKWSAPYDIKVPAQKWKAEQEIKSTFNKAQLDYSDSKFITGQVISEEDGLPIPGVNVFLKGTTVGTISDIDGNYTIEVPEGNWELTFSFIGYRPIDVPLSYNGVINVELEAETVALEDVVVVGYGVQKRKSVVGAISSVKSEDLNGVMAGVSFVKSSGAPGGEIMIRGVSSITSSGKPLVIIDGVAVEDGLESIDPSLIANIEILKDAAATAIYGVRAAEGVILISSKGGKGIPGTTQINDMDVPVQEVSSNSIRSNFSDEAFWQPDLVTNSKGKASFWTTFPDDITSWRTFALAKDRKKRAGQVEGEIKSFKPVSAQLMVPRFLTEGDSVNMIGKSINYLDDTISVENVYQIDTTIIKQWNSKIGRINIDSLAITAGKQDSVSVTYSLRRENGYFDGEKRDIPIVKRGVEEVEGEFFTLDSDTLLSINLPDNCTEGLLYLESNPFNIILKETAHLKSYSHLCNEQSASKLIALLNEEKICNYLSKPFEYKDDVNKLIARIEKSTNEKYVWGWWSGLETQWWITSHVVKALEKARASGYKVTYNKEMAKYEMINRFEVVGNWHKMEILETLSNMHVGVDLTPLVNAINDSSFTRMDSIKFAIIQQNLGIKVDVKPLLREKNETLYGNYFWGKESWCLYNGQIQETLLMYQLLKNDGNYDKWLSKIRAFFYEKRGVSGWRNTYESALIIDAVLPELFSKSSDNKKCSLYVWDGDEKTEVNKFPYSHKLNKDSNVKIEKQGDQVVFAGWHSRYFNEKPEVNDEYFEIKTHFEKDGDRIDSLVAGQKVVMVVDVEVKKKSDYLMLEIPIPSVCSYASKPKRSFIEANREYYKEKTYVYYSTLAKGNYTVRLELVPRYTGKVFINPARMEHMYFPVFYGNNELKSIRIDADK